MARFTATGSFLVALLYLLAGPAEAASVQASQIVSITASARGWITSTNLRNSPSPGGNYLVGNDGVTPTLPGYTGNGEYRNYFQFQLPQFHGTLVQADLVIGTEGVGLLQYSPLVYSITTTGPVLNFNSLGTGTVLGTQNYAPSDYTTVKTIQLDPTLLSHSMIGGSLLTLSGRVTSPTAFSGTAPEEIVFGGSQNNGVFGHAMARLDLTILAVPEPGSVALMGMGLIAIFVLRRNRRT